MGQLCAGLDVAEMERRGTDIAFWSDVEFKQFDQVRFDRFTWNRDVVFDQDVTGRQRMHVGDKRVPAILTEAEGPMSSAIIEYVPRHHDRRAQLGVIVVLLISDQTTPHPNSHEDLP